MKNYSFLLLGGDMRQKYLYESLVAKGYKAELILKNKDEDKNLALNKIRENNVIILPLPSSTDGVNLFAPEYGDKLPLTSIMDRISSDAILFVGGENAAFNAAGAHVKVNLLADEPLTLKNAMATAEAALSIIISNTEKTVFNSKVLVLGYGRIATILTDYLLSLKAKVSVCARKEIPMTLAALHGADANNFDKLNNLLPRCDIIINTIPSKILNEKELCLINPKALIVDLASKPGGIDFVAAERLGLKTIHALSLPGKYSPLSAAEFIEEKILNTLLL